MNFYRLRSDKSDPGYGICPHPDNISNEKYKLCVSGIQQLYDDLTHKSRLKGCLVWVDFSCIDQDLHHLISYDFRNLQEVMSVSDCVFTPVVGPQSTPAINNTSSASLRGAELKGHYRSLDWTGSDHTNRGYLKRAWCLLEMFYAVSDLYITSCYFPCLTPHMQAYIPLATRRQPRRVYTSSSSKCRKFQGRLRLDADCGRRTHVLYGTVEEKAGLPPIAIPSVDSSLMYNFHPLNASFSDPDDIYKLEHLMNQLLPFMSASPSERKMEEFNYTGELNEWGQMTGEGALL